MSRLRQLRTEARMTQDELASEVGVNPSAISHFERGRSEMASPTIRRIAALLAKRLNRSTTQLAGEIVMATDTPLPATPDESCTPLDAKVA